MQVRQTVCQSWFDPEGARQKSAQLARRLRERLQGESVLLITLTYDRSDYSDPEDLWDASTRRRDVKRFVEKLSDELEAQGKPRVAGKWFAKREFQRGGWVHHHLILVGYSRIPHALLNECWGRGFVSVNKRAGYRAAEYLAKYCAKAGEIPAFLHMRRPRSVKLTAASSGFWDRPPVKKPERARLRPMPFYEPIMHVVKRRKHMCSARVTSRERWQKVYRSAASLIHEARWSGWEVVKTTFQWDLIPGPRQRLGRDAAGLYLTKPANLAFDLGQCIRLRLEREWLEACYA